MKERFFSRLPVLVTLSAILYSQLSMGQNVPYDSLSARLITLYDLDQASRMKLINNEIPAVERPTFIKQLNEQDSLNQQEVIQILETYGWLPSSSIGERAATTLFLVIQHSELSVMERYFPLLKSQVEQQEANAMYAAMMEDRMLMYQGKKQIYGSQASSRPSSSGKGNEYFVWPIQDPKEVNARREKVGFPMTVEQNASRLGAIFNPEEELPKKE